MARRERGRQTRGAASAIARCAARLLRRRQAEPSKREEPGPGPGSERHDPRLLRVYTYTLNIWQALCQGRAARGETKRCAVRCTSASGRERSRATPGPRAPIEAWGRL
eukprot:3371147-Prymnesium_polylepis.1